MVLATLAGMLVSACSAAPSLLNATIPRGGYQIHSDIAYGPLPRQKLDVYVPDGLIKPAPIVVFFYGGNWQSGSKELYLAFGQALASEGIVTIVADYRLYPDVNYPGFLNDCALAVRFAHDHAARYSGDPKRLFLAGHSAGAYNVVMLGSDPAYLHAVGMTMSDLAGIIGIAGPYDFLPLTDPALIKMFGGNNRPETQPINHVDGPRPPMLLATGDDDHTVLPRNTLRMAAKLESLKSPVQTRVYKGVGHVGIILSLAPMFRTRTTLRQDIVHFVTAPNR